ncbi:hypothetical protein EAS68_00490 [Legionella jordanis]|uniref:hypothetical protein n=1 Tax=Legionella jordanis TaxID=456 RepID=UPI000EFDF719|nr:hypothetical protein [Legionella jordanis]RMX22042.1 hypothetical protein EAS68_00490 [Legionella jordanis]
MGGQLHLNNGNPQQDRENTCVSGYSRGKENFALSNFDDNNGNGYDFNDPDVGNVHFQTSEHYLHFQKLTPEAKVKYRDKWENTPRPSEILKESRKLPSSDLRYSFKDNKPSAEWDRDKVAVQMQINASKYAQSSSFRDSINKSIELGKSFNDGKGAAVIIEDTSTADHVETNWGTGPDGKGTNILGNTQTAFANMVANKQISTADRTPSLKSITSNPSSQSSYDQAKRQFQNGFQNTLINTRAKAAQARGIDPYYLRTDTSDLGGSLVRRAALNGTVQMTPMTSSTGFNQASSNRIDQLSQKMHSTRQSANPISFGANNPLTFKTVPVSVATAGFQGLRDALKKQQIPVADNGHSLIDYYLSASSDNKSKMEAAHLLTGYAVKSVMGNLAVESRMSVVDNIGKSTAAIKHDAHALKIEFKSAREASEFARKLAEQGITSHTFPGQMKTPQGKNKNLIFLTQSDLEKIAEKSKLAEKTSAGMAYKTVTEDFKQSKYAKTQSNQMNRSVS